MVDITLAKLFESISNEASYKTYLFKQSKKNFLYESDREDVVIGVNSLLNDKIIRMNNLIIKSNRALAHVFIEDQEIGWTEININELIRLYRTPKITGRIDTNKKDIEFYDGYFNQISRLESKLVKVYYVFTYKNDKYFMIGDLSRNIIAPISLNSLLILNRPLEIKKIYLNEGQALFTHSNLVITNDTVKKSGEYQVLSYYNNSTLVKIDYKGKELWVDIENDLEQTNFTIFDDNELEMMDYLMWISEERKSLSKQKDQLEKRFDFIRNHLVVDIEENKLYIEKYLGEFNDS